MLREETQVNNFLHELIGIESYFLLIVFMLCRHSSHVCREFEEKLSAFAGHDPLAIWLSYIKAVMAQCIDQTHAVARPVMEQCFRTFFTDERYKDDARFLRLCISYADMTPHARQVLEELRDAGIGIHFALFWQAYTLVLEKSRKFDSAKKAYEEGMRVLPEDERVTLNHPYKAFKKRVAARHKSLKERKAKAKAAGEASNSGRAGQQQHNERRGLQDITGMVDATTGRRLEGRHVQRAHVPVHHVRQDLVTQQSHQHGASHSGGNDFVVYSDKSAGGDVQQRGPAAQSWRVPSVERGAHENMQQVTDWQGARVRGMGVESHHIYLGLSTVILCCLRYLYTICKCTYYIFTIFYV